MSAARPRVGRLLIGDVPPAHAARVDGEAAILERAGLFHEILVLGVGPAPRIPDHWADRGGLALGVTGPRAMIRAAGRWVGELQPDVIHAHNLWAALIAAAARRRAGAPASLLYETHGALAFEALEKHRGPTRMARFALLYLLENGAFLAADRALLVSDQIRRYYPAARTLPTLSIPRVVQRVDGGGVRDRSTELVGVLEYADRCRAEGRRILVYSGGPGRWQRLEETLAVMSRAIAGGAAALILTYAPAAIRTALEPALRDSEWLRVASLPRDEVPCALRACDVGLLLREAAVLNRVASPTKFFEYLAAGVHVVTTPGAEAVAEVVQHHDAGLLVELELAAEQVPAWVTSVDRSPEERSRLISLAEQRFTWAAVGDELLSLYG